MYSTVIQIVFILLEFVIGARFNSLIMSDFHFAFAAKYDTPTLKSIDPENSPNVNKILICETRGGYPQGELRWFDENKTEWTKSAKLLVNRTKNSVDLHSVLDLLKGSTFSEYTCVVYNSSGSKEESATISLPPGKTQERMFCLMHRHTHIV